MVAILGRNMQGAFTALSLFGLLVACASMTTVHAKEMTDFTNESAVRVMTADEHRAAAKHFENAAQEIHVKLEAQRERLVQHGEERRYGGWRARNEKSHILALIRRHNQAMESNMRVASFHHQMVQSADRLDYVERSDQGSTTGSN